jgi:hypothetical protein
LKTGGDKGVENTMCEDYEGKRERKAKAVADEDAFL